MSKLWKYIHFDLATRRVTPGQPYKTPTIESDTSPGLDYTEIPLVRSINGLNYKDVKSAKEYALWNSIEGVEDHIKKMWPGYIKWPQQLDSKPVKTVKLNSQGERVVERGFQVYLGKDDPANIPLYDVEYLFQRYTSGPLAGALEYRDTTVYFYFTDKTRDEVFTKSSRKPYNISTIDDNITVDRPTSMQEFEIKRKRQNMIYYMKEEANGAATPGFGKAVTQLVDNLFSPIHKWQEDLNSSAFSDAIAIKDGGFNVWIDGSGEMHMVDPGSAAMMNIYDVPVDVQGNTLQAFLLGRLTGAI